MCPRAGFFDPPVANTPLSKTPAKSALGNNKATERKISEKPVERLQQTNSSGGEVFIASVPRTHTHTQARAPTHPHTRTHTHTHMRARAQGTEMGTDTVHWQ